MIAPAAGEACSATILAFCGQWEHVESGVISTALSLQSCFSLFFITGKEKQELMHETILQLAEKQECWQQFLDYKIEKQHLSCEAEKQIGDFIERKAYEPLCKMWEKGAFPSVLPTRKIVNKEGTNKKRVVYSFEGDEGIFLKFIAFHLYRYDNMFCDNCYAFRRGIGARNALQRLKEAGIDHCYCLKADISNYFNSINEEALLEKLAFLKEDPALYQLFEKILSEDRVKEGNRIICEKQGAMAGTPFSPFLANVYLSEMDFFFKNEGVLYFRYSDDILLFAPDKETLCERKKQLYDRIADRGLSINPEKVCIYEPGERIEFLGFSYQKGAIDLSENTLRKTKAKIKRKAKALRRWQQKKELTGEKAAIGFIRAMNRKFFGSGKEDEDEFTWNRWFFPSLTVDRGLKEIDAYMQQYIRYTVTGRHYKGNYRIRYDAMKKWGYLSLVNEYYKQKKCGEKLL